MRLNAGLKMMLSERLGGGLRYFSAYGCGKTWSSAHFGCARWGQICVISYDSPPLKPGSTTPTPRQEDIWLIDLNGEKEIPTRVRITGLKRALSYLWTAQSLFSIPTKARTAAAMRFTLSRAAFPMSHPVRRPP